MTFAEYLNLFAFFFERVDVDLHPDRQSGDIG